LFPGDLQTVGGRPTQARWVFDRWMTQGEWQKEYDVKEFCPDGSRIANHTDNGCAKPMTRAEGFSDYEDSMSNTLLTVAILLGLAATLGIRYANA